MQVRRGICWLLQGLASSGLEFIACFKALHVRCWSLLPASSAAWSGELMTGAEAEAEVIWDEASGGGEGEGEGEGICRRQRCARRGRIQRARRTRTEGAGAGAGAGTGTGASERLAIKLSGSA